MEVFMDKSPINWRLNWPKHRTQWWIFQNAMIDCQQVDARIGTPNDDPIIWRVFKSQPSVASQWGWSMKLAIWITRPRKSRAAGNAHSYLHWDFADGNHQLGDSSGPFLDLARCSLGIFPFLAVAIPTNPHTKTLSNGPREIHAAYWAGMSKQNTGSVKVSNPETSWGIITSHDDTWLKTLSKSWWYVYVSRLWLYSNFGYFMGHEVCC